MRTRISKCQSGGKETSINRPSNIYSIIDRREVGFLRWKKNNRKMTTLFVCFFMYVCVWRHKHCIFRVSLLLTAVSQVGSRTPERQMEVLSQQFMRPVNVWKTVWRREKKWKEIHAQCAALAATGSTVCTETIHINTYIHAIIRRFDTTLRVEISRKPKR